MTSVLVPLPSDLVAALVAASPESSPLDFVRLTRRVGEAARTAVLADVDKWVVASVPRGSATNMVVHWAAGDDGALTSDFARAKRYGRDEAGERATLERRAGIGFAMPAVDVRKACGLMVAPTVEIWTHNLRRLVRASFLALHGCDHWHHCLNCHRGDVACSLECDVETVGDVRVSGGTICDECALKEGSDAGAHEGLPWRPLTRTTRKEGRPMRTITKAEWDAEGRARYGDDTDAWAFVCPVCKYRQTVADYKAAGAPETAVGFSCVGRWIEGSKEAFTKSKAGPCTYAGGGLFKLNPVRVTLTNGPAYEVFEWADPHPAGGLLYGVLALPTNLSLADDWCEFDGCHDPTYGTLRRAGTREEASVVAQRLGAQQHEHLSVRVFYEVKPFDPTRNSARVPLGLLDAEASTAQLALLRTIDRTHLLGDRPARATVAACAARRWFCTRLDEQGRLDPRNAVRLTARGQQQLERGKGRRVAS